MDQRFLQIGARRVDLDTGEVDGFGVLRPLERAVLRYLAEQEGRPVPVHELHTAVWGHAPTVDSRTAYSTVKRLRPLIEPDPRKPQFLHAVRGAGYRLTGARWLVESGPTPHGLPAARDPFIGRVAELEQLAALARAGARLITVTALGGMGKTRLAQHHARSVGGRTWWCDLTAARSGDEIGQAVVRALALPVDPHPVEAAARGLAQAGEGLLVLDNFEHLVELGEITVGSWLDAAPQLAILVTSRERLGLVCENVLALGPMVPCDARALLVARARALGRDGGDLDDERAVDQLLGLLDRLPLAIELAAARLRLLSIREVIDRMSERFALLQAGDRRPARHSTLRVTLDGSWELLDDVLREALAQLSVFVGGFELAAAEAVLDLGSGGCAPPVLDALQALVDRSLLVPAGADGRFSLLESVAAYAAERLDERGGRDSAERRHGQWVARAKPPRTSDLQNFATACRRALARRDAPAAAATFSVTTLTALDVGPCSVILELGPLVLSLPDLSTRERSATFVGLALVRIQTGEFAAALSLFDEALALAREGDDRGRIGRTLGRRGLLWAKLGRHAEAMADYRAALQELDDPGDRATVLGNLGAELMDRDPDAAVRVMSEAAEIHRMLAHPVGEAIVLGNLAVLCLRGGRLDEAEDLLLRSQGASRRSGSLRAEALTATNLGDLALRRGHPDDAESAYRWSLELAGRVGDRQTVALAQAGLGEVAAWRALPRSGEP